MVVAERVDDAKRRGSGQQGMNRIRMIRRPPVAKHPLQRQIADALCLEIAPPGKVSRDGVVWWSVDHASYAGTAPGARVGCGIVAGVPDLFVLHPATSQSVILIGDV